MAGRPVPDTRIVGGERGRAGRAVAGVAAGNRGGHICGGSIVRSDAVVTAAHCTVGRHRGH
ncbi:trypsin-like serine protease [Streptomyces albulus]|nr:trypsin-like serine protease [Streptomyces noursei]